MSGNSGFRGLLLAIVIGLSAPCRAQELEFHFLDVDQGDSTLIICPNGLTVLVDCGSLSSSSTVRDRTRQYLVEHLSDAPKIDVVVITHPDTDHYRLLPDVLEGIDVGLLLHVGSANSHSVNNVDDWIRSVSNRRSLKVDDIDAADQPSELFDSGDVEFHILAANVPASASAKNARSIVLRVDLDEFEAILTGDATFDTERSIAGNYTPEFLDVELLKIGHHGSSATSTADEWVQLLRPVAAVVSAGFDSPFQHPRKSVIDRVAQSTDDDAPPHFMRWGVRRQGSTRLQTVSDYTEAIFNTASNGNIVVTTDGSEFQIHYGGDGGRSGEMELLASAGRGLPPGVIPRGVIGGTPLAESTTASELAAEGPPIEIGQPISVETEAGRAAGAYQGFAAGGWLMITDAEGDTTFIRGDAMVIRPVREPEREDAE